ncbi:MAG: type VI secretion system baseplate subunit TssK [Gemmataceae bacterium]|nr:type VI secretion system baseplate subunit TssK [Gemmataceae bacterium]
MTEQAVHWFEGMALWPHMMQQAERFGLRQLHLSHNLDVHHDWGLRALDLDVGALASYRFAARALKARLKDGTMVSAPEDGSLAALDLRPALQTSSTITVYLGVPKLHLGRANTRDPNEPAVDGEAARARWVVGSEEIEDENAPDNPQSLRVRLLNFKLLVSTEDHSGYEVLPIARVQKPAEAEATPQLDRTYIPPLLACESWPALAADILEHVYHRVGKKIDLRANQVVSRGITFDSKTGQDPLIFNQLHVLNEAYALLGTLVFAEGIHPLPAYVELCRLVGQLAVFGDTRKVPDLPRYDHDDLGGCFWRVKQYLDELMGEVGELTYKERPFEGQGLRMQVVLEPEWLEPAWEMFVGVESPLAAEECVRLLTRGGQLDMKIGSTERVDDIFMAGTSGLKFTHSQLPPRALPARGGLIFFQVSRESQLQEWQHVQRSRTLAIRLNQNRVVGTIQGQRTLTIKTTGQPTTMSFTLFLVPRQG